MKKKSRLKKGVKNNPERERDREKDFLSITHPCCGFID